MTGRVTRIILFLAAAMIGGMAAFWLMPRLNDMRAISHITSTDLDVRDRGWRWLSSSRSSDPEPRAAHVIDRINLALADAADEPLLHAADVLRPMDVWGWQFQPNELVLRELALRAKSHLGDQQLAAVELRDCPLDAPEESLLSIGQDLLSSDDPSVRALTMRGILGWAGIERAGILKRLRVPEDDYAMERLRRLAMSWARVPVDDMLDDVAEIPLDVLEAALLQHVRAQPDDASTVIDIRQAFRGNHDASFAYVLRHSRDAAATVELQAMAEQNSDVARFALHARDPEWDARRAKEIAQNERETIWRRRLGAWRADRLDEATRDAILAAPVADIDGTVYAAALLAERLLEPGEQVQLAELWMRDLNNDRKRAGGLLAAMTGHHLELLNELVSLPDAPAVRTTARLASASMLDEDERREVIELGHRALRKPDGDFDPDTMLAMLTAGADEFLEVLVDPPRGEWRTAIQQRAMLIERFVPDWHNEAGRPISGDGRTILLHFDWLRARRLLEARRTTFDSRTREYRAAAAP